MIGNEWGQTRAYIKQTAALVIQVSLNILVSAVCNDQIGIAGSNSRTLAPAIAVCSLRAILNQTR